MDGLQDTSQIKPVDAYLEFIDPIHSNYQIMIVSGMEAAGIKSALLSAANSTTDNYMYLRHFLNPVGETAIGIGDLESLSDEQRDAQKLMYVLMSLFNGDSGINPDVTEYFLGETPSETRSTYNNFIQEILTPLSSDDVALFLKYIQFNQQVRGKEIYFKGSPLKRLIEKKNYKN